MKHALMLALFVAVLGAGPAHAQGYFLGYPINATPYVRIGNTVVAAPSATGCGGYQSNSVYAYPSASSGYYPNGYGGTYYSGAYYPSSSNYPSSYGGTNYPSSYGGANYTRSYGGYVQTAPVHGYGAPVRYRYPVAGGTFGTTPTVQTFSGAPQFGSYNNAAYGARGVPTGVVVRRRR